MHKTDSGFYVIDVLPLHNTSKRPFHLEKRMKSKKSFSSYGHGHGDDKLLQYSPYDAQMKREAILEQRRLKLARQFLHVKDVLIKQHQRALNDSSAKRSQIQQTLRLAEKNRNTILQRLVEQCAQEVARCKEVARQQQLKNQEEIDRRRADLERRQRATAARRARLLTVPKSRIFSNEMTIPPTREEAA
ncbi:16590_t:CDS:1, partial [Funneliformis mosseae]